MTLVPVLVVFLFLIFSLHEHMFFYLFLTPPIFIDASVPIVMLLCWPFLIDGRNINKETLGMSVSVGEPIFDVKSLTSLTNYRY